MDSYQIIFWAYFALALLTLVSTIRNLLGKVELNPGGASFQNCAHFSESNKKRLDDHYSSLMGTLCFWKKRAEIYTSFHYYSAQSLHL